jgi:hypothetical protein
VSRPPSLTTYQLGDSLSPRADILRKLMWSPENGVRSPQILYIARRITSGCQGRDAMCELRKIYQFTVENVRYAGDIAGVDTFCAPRWTLLMGAEDCDGHAVLNAALAAANGFQTKFRITSNRGTSWDHIYTMAGFPKSNPTRWIALDTTLARSRQDFSRFGVEPPRAKYQDFLATLKG